MFYRLLTPISEISSSVEAESEGGLSTPVAVFLLILVVLICAALSVFLYFSVKRERNRYITEKLKIGELDAQGFDDLIARRFRNAGKNTHFSVMQIYVNDSARIKQSFGEKQYERALNTIIERIYKALPVGSKVCIYAPDIVAAFIEEDLDKTDLTSLAAFCLVECRKPIRFIAGLKQQLDLNIAMELYANYCTSAEEFKNNLDLAMSASVKGGVNRFTLYSSDLSDRQSEEYKYYQEIKSAIDANEFTVYFQPIYNLEENKLFAFEGLLRWNHRTLGVLAPNKFLHIMEQTGDINWVGTWAFEQIIIASQSYKSRHPDSDVTFSVNLSPKQLMNPKLIEDFRRVVKKYRANPSDFCMEIVEFAMFDKMPEVKDNIQKLSQFGFKVAIDDFGLEMSTLKTLETMHVNWVKLDREFLDRAKDDFLFGSMVGTLVTYARENDVKIIAEGVEDDVTVEYVKERSIPYGQGYFFGKPKAPQEYDI